VAVYLQLPLFKIPVNHCSYSGRATLFPSPSVVNSDFAVIGYGRMMNKKGTPISYGGRGHIFKLRSCFFESGSGFRKSGSKSGNFWIRIRFQNVFKFEKILFKPRQQSMQPKFSNICSLATAFFKTESTAENKKWRLCIRVRFFTKF